MRARGGPLTLRTESIEILGEHADLDRLRSSGYRLPLRVRKLGRSYDFGDA